MRRAPLPVRLPTQILKIYTDGSCHPNPGPGGWGFVVYDQEGKEIHAARAGRVPTTSNTMEMHAVLEALVWARGRPCEIWTDSQWVVDALTRFGPAWKAAGWKTRAGRNVRNAPLIRPTLAMYERTLCRVYWTKAHAGTVGNERADRLAKEGRRSPTPGRYYGRKPYRS